MKYRPEIDGLRTVAVLPVVFFHAGIGPFHGGFAGVDIFFVISGYLITFLIICDLEKGRFSILDFYERRARRILPALFTVLAISSVVAVQFMYPLELNEFAQSVVATIVFSSNIFFWLKSDYFATAAELKPLLHTWSLAVEEQYYVVFPPLMVLIWKSRHRYTHAIAILSGIALLSFLACITLGDAWANAAFYLLPFRAWELAIGALCAIVLSRRTVPQNPVGAWLGLILIGAGLLLGREDAWPSWQTLLPTVGTALVILFATGDRGIGRVLATRPMVWVGLMSYSLYLWHQPLFAFARLRLAEDLSPELKLALVATAIMLAWLTWHLVEQPFRKRKEGAFRIGRKQLAATMGATASVFLIFGMIGDATDGWPDRTAPSGLTFAQISRDLAGGRINIGPCDIDLAYRNAPKAPLQDCVFMAETTSEPRHAILLGDSHATILTSGIVARLTSAGYETSVAAFGDCIPFPGFRTRQRNCAPANSAMYEHVAQSNYDLIVLAFRPQSMLDNLDAIVPVNSADAYSDGITGLQTLIRSGLHQLLETGANLIVFEPIPNMPVDIGHLARNRFAFDPGHETLNYEIPFDVYLEQTAPVLEVLRSIDDPRLSLIESALILCDGDALSCPGIKNGVVLYVDDNHLSRFGVDKLMAGAEGAFLSLPNAQ